MTRPYTIEEIKEVAVPIAQRHGVNKLALFGSYAKNEATLESDIDFLSDASDIIGWAFYGFVNDLEEAFEVGVDVIEYDGLNGSLIENVINEEVTLYER